MTGLLGLDTARASALTAIEPRTRLLAAASFAIVVITCSDYPALVAALALGLALTGLAGLSGRAILHRLLHLDGFILLAVASLPFATPGEPVFVLGPLTASREGLDHAARIALQANAVALTLFALAGTLEPNTLGRALAGLAVPERLVQLLLLTIRYLETLQRQFARLRVAMKARAFRARSDLHTWRSLGYLFGMLLVRSVDRAERIMMAMKCRGYDGHLSLEELAPPAARDRWFALGWLALLGALIGLDRG